LCWWWVVGVCVCGCVGDGSVCGDVMAAAHGE
jgi:hypothetical protein